MRIVAVAAAALALAVGAAGAHASAPPVGPLPLPTVTSVKTARGQLVSLALPRRAGYVWRIARPVPVRVVTQVGEGDVGTTVVLVFRAVGRGRASVLVAETRGETPRAVRAVRLDVTVT
jgi:hypothetical protein